MARITGNHLICRALQLEGVKIFTAISKESRALISDAVETA